MKNQVKNHLETIRQTNGMRQVCWKPPEATERNENHSEVTLYYNAPDNFLVDLAVLVNLAQGVRYYWTLEHDFVCHDFERRDYYCCQ